MSNRDFRLCYVDGNIMYFTDNFENQWGDDWDDSPYEHNAGEPYEIIDGEDSKQDGYGHIRRFAFTPHWNWKTPCYGTINSPYSVRDINSGAMAWLYSNGAGSLNGGATIDEAKEWMQKADAGMGEIILPGAETVAEEGILDETAKKNLLGYLNGCEEYARHVLWDVLHEIGAEQELKEYVAQHRPKLKIA